MHEGFSRVHARVFKTQFIHQIFINSRLIDAYGKCGYLEDERKVFAKMHNKIFKAQI